MKNIADFLDKTFDYKGFEGAIGGEPVVWNEWRNGLEEKLKTVKNDSGLYSKYITMLEVKLEEKKYESGFGPFVERLIACMAILVPISGLLVSGFIASQSLYGQFWTNLSEQDSSYFEKMVEQISETYTNIWVFSGDVAFGCLLLFLLVYIIDIILRSLDIKIKRTWDKKRVFYLYLYNEMKRCCNMYEQEEK